MSPPPLLVPAIEPPPSAWSFAQLLADAGEEDLIGVGGDLDPGTLLAAYRSGVFPMGVGGLPVMGWWSPVERGILQPSHLHVSRSLRRSAPRFTCTVDQAFAAVVDGCAFSGRTGDWITPDIAAAYRVLHELGWAHSIEVWSRDGLAGGVYGVGVGGLFAGESMFHRATDASKAALVGLVDVLTQTAGPTLVDVQWRTEHLAGLGITTVPRATYLELLPVLTRSRGPDWARWRQHRWRPGHPEGRSPPTS